MCVGFSLRDTVLFENTGADCKGALLVETLGWWLDFFFFFFNFGENAF